MFTEKEIYSALDLIRRVCESQKDCSNCPFFSKFGNGCARCFNNECLYDAPCDWELTPPPEPTK